MQRPNSTEGLETEDPQDVLDSDFTHFYLIS